MIRKSLIFLLSILVFSAVLRFYALSIVPPGISNDEVFGAYNAYSLIETGKDLAGEPWYKSLLIVSPNYTQSELQSIYYIPMIKLFGLSLFSVRLTNAVLGMFSILLMFIFVKALSKSTKIALLSAFVLAISPWHVLITRTAFEMPMAFTMVLLSLCLILTLPRKLIFLALIPLIVAFLTYDGIKVLFLPLVGIVAFLRWQDTVVRKNLLIFFGIGVLFFVFFVFLFSNYSGASTRLNEISFLSSPDNISSIKLRRTESLAPVTLTKIFINRGEILSKRLVDNMFNLLSPQLLFMGGDGAIQQSVWVHGVLYTLDSIFLILGLYYMTRKSKRILIFACLLFFVGAIPAIISSLGQAYVLRAMLTLIVFCLTISYGLYFVSYSLRRKNIGFIIVIGISLLYTVLLSNFIFIYFYQYPSFGAGGLYTGDRLIQQYIGYVPKNKNISVLANEPLTHFLQYALYAKVDPRIVQRQWYKKTFLVDNVSFIGDCKQRTQSSVLITHIDKYPCEKNSIQTLDPLHDSFGRWVIEGDRQCLSYSAPRNQYQVPHTWKDFSTLPYSPLTTLCTKWFVHNLSN